MPKLNVPSLQHLARNWRETAPQVSDVLVRLAKNLPTFNYNPLFSAARDMLLFKTPYDQIENGIRKAVKRKDLLDNYLEVLPLIGNYFEGISPNFVHAVDRRFYPVARGLMVPFEPPLIYGINGEIHFPWFSFWRSNPIAERRLQLFVSVVYEVLLQDPDLEEAHFTILDFSAPKGRCPRELNIINARDIQRIPKDEMSKMLAIFAEGFFLAEQKLAKGGVPDQQEEREWDEDGDQPSFDF